MDGSSSDDEDMQQQEEQWEQWEEEDGEDGDDEPTPSLFNPAHLLPSPLAAIEHDAQEHGFNLLAFALQERLDEYDIIRAINFIRLEVQQGRQPLTGPSHSLPPPAPPSSNYKTPWQDDRYLLPVLPEDPLLCFDFQEALEQLQQQQQQQQEGAASSSQADAQALDQQLQADRRQRALQEENRALRDENDALREMVLQLRLEVMPAELKLEEAERAGRAGAAPSSIPHPSLPTGTTAIPTAHLHPTASAPSSSGPAAVRPASASCHGPGRADKGGAAGGPSAGQAAKEEVDSSYFDSYSGFNIHREMLSDKPRTNAYRAAIEGNPSLIAGKRVLDVGCGTGILSLFAARAGACRVVAVDGSASIAKIAAQIAKANGHSVDAGGPIDVVSARVEQLAQLPGGVNKVDVIVSEWMGYALLFETMLDSVLVARDRWLAPGGVVLPDVATIHLAGAGRGALGLQFWKDVYGFSMQPVVEELRAARQGRANVLAVEPSDIVTDTVLVKSMDLCTMKSEDQDFTTEFVLRARDFEWPGSHETGVHEVHAIVLWFDALFSAARCPEAEVVLSTSPYAPTTHWAQTVLPLKQPLALSPAGTAAATGGGLKWTHEIRGRLSMARNKSKHRSLDISLEYNAVLADGTAVQDTSVYAMSVLQ